jgi:hypothetical protein
VLSGSNGQFKVVPTYYAGLFNNLVLGEVISSNVTVGPIELQYPDGMNKATVTAKISGQSIALSVDYSIVQTISLALVQQRIASLPPRPANLISLPHA